MSPESKTKKQSTTRFSAIGYMFAILQAILYSTLGVFSKLLYATGLNVQQVTILRFLCASILIGAFILVHRKQSLISKQPETYIQAIFFYASSLLYLFAVEKMTAGMTTVVFFTYPTMVAIASVFALKEKIRLSVICALILATVGTSIVSGVIDGKLTLDALGIVYAIGSAASFAIYTVMIQVTRSKEEPLTVTFTLSWTSFLASCIVFAPVLPSMLNINLAQIGLGLLFALFATVIPIFVFIEAVKHIGGTKTALIGMSETPFSLIIAFLVLGETITLYQGIGSFLIVASIAIITITPRFEAVKNSKDNTCDS